MHSELERMERFVKIVKQTSRSVPLLTCNPLAFLKVAAEVPAAEAGLCVLTVLSNNRKKTWYILLR